MKIGIVGLGLIGGSFAKACSSRTGHTIYGYDTDARTMEMALQEDAVHAVLTQENLAEMDLLLLAVVPHLAIRYVEENAERIRGIVMDLCGVKRMVSGKLLPLSQKHGFLYIGAHPMAGREHGGYDNAASDMFDGASMILVPHDEIPEAVYILLRELGFSTMKLSTDALHDRMIAFTSQMAHVVSNNYCKSEVGEQHAGYSADSLRDLTRVAGLNAAMWSELFIGNKDNLLQELDRLLQDMTEMRNAIETENAGRLEELLEEGSQAKYRLFPRGVACDTYPS